MAKSRRTEKQQLMKDYDAILQELKAEEERLQYEEDVYWQLLMLEEEERLQREEESLFAEECNERECDAFNDSFENCWPDYDPWLDYVW